MQGIWYSIIFPDNIDFLSSLAICAVLLRYNLNFIRKVSHMNKRNKLNMLFNDKDYRYLLICKKRSCRKSHPPPSILHTDMSNTSYMIASQILFATRFRKTIITTNKKKIYRNLKRPKRMAFGRGWGLCYRGGCLGRQHDITRNLWLKWNENTWSSPLSLDSKARLEELNGKLKTFRIQHANSNF